MLMSQIVLRVNNTLKIQNKEQSFTSNLQKCWNQVSPNHVLNHTSEWLQQFQQYKWDTKKGGEGEGEEARERRNKGEREKGPLEATEGQPGYRCTRWKLEGKRREEREK